LVQDYILTFSPLKIKFLTKKPRIIAVFYWCIYTTPLEPILSKIPEKIQSLSPTAKRRGFAPPAETETQKFSEPFFPRPPRGADSLILEI